MGDRRLIRTSSPSSSGTTNTEANVVGLLPETAYNLYKQHATQSSPSRQLSDALVARIHSNGTAMLATGDDMINIWQTRLYTLSETLVAPTDCSLYRIPTSTTNSRPLTEHRMVLAGGASNGGGAANLYAVAGTDTVHYWNTPEYPDASLSLPFGDSGAGTEITILQSAHDYDSERQVGSWVLAGTSRGGLWLMALNNRPLELRARELEWKRRKPAQDEANNGGLVNTFGRLLGYTSPSLDDGSTSCQHESVPLHTILPLPNLDQGTAVDDPSFDSTLGSPRPKQRQRLRTNSKSCWFYTLQENFHVCLWNVREAKPAEDMSTGASGSSLEETVVCTSDDLNLRTMIITTVESVWKNSSLTDVVLLRATLCTSNTDSSTSRTLLPDILLTIRVTDATSASHRLYFLHLLTNLPSQHSPAATPENIITRPFLTLLPQNILWLSRHPSAHIPNLSNVGLTHDPETSVAYTLWKHDTEPSGIHQTAIHVRAGDGTTLGEISDVELPTRFVSKILGLGVQRNCGVGQGVLLISDTGCLIDSSVKFPMNATAITTQGSMINSSGVNVDTLTSHLMSAFLQASHQQKKSAANHLPPSLHEASVATLEEAVARCSTVLTNGGIDTTDRRNIESQTCLDRLKERLQRHVEFVNFLIHAGLVRKISRSRCVLSNHGEMLSASQSLFQLLDEYALAASSSSGDVETEVNNHTMANDATVASQTGIILSAKIHHLENDCTDVLSYLSSIIEHVDDGITSNNSQQTLATESLCAALVSIQNWRTRHVEMGLYDAPTNGSEQYVKPWTCSDKLRNMIATRLQSISGGEQPRVDQMETMVRALLQSHVDDDDDSTDHDQRYAYHKRIAIPVLRSICGDDLAMQLSLDHCYFSGIMKLCDDECLLLQQQKYNMVNDEFSADIHNDGLASLNGRLGILLTDPNSPLRSLKAIVRCQDGTSMKFPRYVLQWCANRKRYGDLLDIGYRFCIDELQIFLEQDEHHHIVMEEEGTVQGESVASGGAPAAHCRVKNVKWIHDLRREQYDDAASHLVTMVTSAAQSTSNTISSDTDMVEQEPHQPQQSLEDRRFFLSMAKLASRLATPKEQQQSPGANVKLLQKRHERQQLINDGLVLIRAQEIVTSQGGTEEVDLILRDNKNSDAKKSASEALMGETLLDIACERIIDCNMEFEERIRSTLAGLAIAEIMTPREEADASVSSRKRGCMERASFIWRQTILGEIQTWQSLVYANERNELSEDAMKQHLSETLFVCVHRDYQSAKKQQQQAEHVVLTDISFAGNGQIRIMVLQDLSSYIESKSEELGKLLQIAAGLVFQEEDDLEGIN